MARTNRTRRPQASKAARFVSEKMVARAVEQHLAMERAAEEAHALPREVVPFGWSFVTA